MKRIKLLIVFLFFVALATGFFVGLGVAHSKFGADAMPGGGKGKGFGSRPPSPHLSLIETLALTPAQSEQLKAIWSEWDPARPARPSERPSQFQKERDDAILALLSDSQKIEFDEIQKKYRHQLDQLDDERRQAFQVAVDKTKAILNDTQRAKYDEILKNAPPPRGPRTGGSDRNRGPTTRRAPASQPAPPAPGSAGGATDVNAGE